MASMADFVTSQSQQDPPIWRSLGWDLGRQWQGFTLDAWRRSLDLLR